MSPAADFRAARAGGFLGLAIALKMSPALLVFFLVWHRCWREAAVAVAAAAALVLGSGLLLADQGGFFLGTVLKGFQPGQPYHGLALPLNMIGNSSLGALAWQIGGDPHSMRLKLTSIGRTAHIGMAAGLVALWAWRSRRGLAWEASLAAGVVLMVILPTYTFEHHLVYLTLPFALCLRLYGRGRLSGALVAALVVCYAVLAQPVARTELLARCWEKIAWLKALSHLWKLPFLLVAFTALLVVGRDEHRTDGRPRTSP